MQDLKNIIESLLFVAEEPLSIAMIKEVLETVDGNEIRSALQDLAEDYQARGGGFKLCEVAGGWQLRSRPEYHEWIKRMLQPAPQRLSRAALETLAIVAYKQPIIRADIEHIRGVDSGGVLRQLMERKLIRVLGRREIAGRPLIYATTKLFLELFDLKDLKDLPSPAEIEQLGQPVDRPVAQTDQTDQAEQAEQVDQVDQGDQAEQAEQVDQGDQVEQVEQAAEIDSGLDAHDSGDSAVEQDDLLEKQMPTGEHEPQDPKNT